MGCWNGTCAISQLPIRSGDPVRVILLAIDTRDSDFTTGYCYSSGIAYPLTPPVLGSYDDYGGATFDNPDAAAIFAFKALGIDIASLEDGDLQEVMRANDFGVSTCLGRFKVGLWIAHEPIYRHMLERVNDVDGNRFRALDWPTLRGLAETVCDQMAEVAAQMKTAEEAKTVDEILERQAMLFWLGFPIPAQRGEVGLQQIWERVPTGLRIGFQTITMHMSDMVTKGATREEMLPFCHAVADIIRLSEAMEITRRGFWVQSGAGSQSSDHEAHISLAKCIGETAAAFISRDREENEDWENDEAVPEQA